MPRATARAIFVAYVPVLHRGYLQFFEANQEARELYIIGGDLLKKVDYIDKDLRAMPPPKAVEIMRAAGRFDTVMELTSEAIPNIDKSNVQVIMPDEDISRAIGSMFKKVKIKYFPIFLRWDRRMLKKSARKDPNEVISTRKIDKDRMNLAYGAASSSSDIWRRVGALLMTKKGRQVGLTANQGEPSAHSPTMEGDPRNMFNQGVGIEMSIFMHAEAALIAKAAKDGIKLEGGSMYVTTFPCPYCAKLIAHSGIKNLYYSDGYGVLDGKRVLEGHSVNLKRVVVTKNSTKEDPNVWVPYKKT